LCGNNATFLESSKEKFKVWLLKQALGWSLWVRRIGNDDIELILVVIKKFEAIPNMDLDLWVLVADGHSWKIFLGQADNSLQIT